MNVAILAGVVAALAAVLGVVFQLFPRRPGIRIRRIRKHTDRDLTTALDLPPDSRVDPNTTDKPEQIIEWFEQIEAETRAGTCKLDDYFVVAKIGGAICGYIYCQYYRASKLLFVSYVQVEKGTAPPGEVANRLILYVLCRMRWKGCTGVVTEVEDRARAHVFKTAAWQQRIKMIPLDINYRQPKLSLWDPECHEQPLFLLYARIGPDQLGSEIPRAEIERVLRFVYGELYGDCFEDDPVRDKAYRAYTNALYEEMVAGLPLGNALPLGLPAKPATAAR